MVLAKVVEKAPGSVAFAVVLDVAVLFDDGFWAQGDNFFVVGMDQNGSQHLMIVGDFAVAAFLLQAGRAMDVFGRKIGDAIQGQQIMALKKGERFEGLAALQLPKDAVEGGTE